MYDDMTRSSLSEFIEVICYKFKENIRERKQKKTHKRSRKKTQTIFVVLMLCIIVRN